MPRVDFEKLSVTADSVWQLKSNMTYSCLKGNYKEYKKASKSLAHIAMQDFDLVKNTKGMQVKGGVPIFSVTFLRMAKVIILNKLRIKTPEEKQFAIKMKEENMRDVFRKNVREQVKSSIRNDIDNKIQPKIDALAEERTDYLMTLIPKDLMKILEDDVVKQGGKFDDSQRNDAVKTIRYFMKDERTAINTKFFNSSTLQELNK